VLWFSSGGVVVGLFSGWGGVWVAFVVFGGGFFFGVVFCSAAGVGYRGFFGSFLGLFLLFGFVYFFFLFLALGGCFCLFCWFLLFSLVCFFSIFCRLLFSSCVFFCFFFLGFFFSFSF